MKTENHRVLIIDDERPVLMTVEALLRRHGYQVDAAATALQGLKLLKSNSPSLVLLDLQLPDAHGLEMLDQIKTELPKAQVIILTAHDSLHNAIESIKRGAYHFISKPKNFGRRRSDWRSGSRLPRRGLLQFLTANPCRKLRN